MSYPNQKKKRKYYYSGPKRQKAPRKLSPLDEARKLLRDFNPDALIEQAATLQRRFVLHVGPTNSGKTHDAIEALKAAKSGTYLGPLRLLALEMFDRLNAAEIPCSLLTGEESIPTEDAHIVSSTIELCDYYAHFSVAIIDEAQLISDPDRGSAWLKAICLVNADEVHICLAPEAQDMIENLILQFGSPYQVIHHERLVPLVYSGRCQGYNDIQSGDAIICFSRKNVLSTAALLERNGFHASVIYGALPPVARRNEVEKYTSGKTNVIVATDAIGLGISLPIRRIIFAETQKYDGKERRPLTPAEIKQISGRAGRYGMFDLGEVLTMDSTDIIPHGLSLKPGNQRTLCIPFPKEALTSSFPIDVLLKAWKTLPSNPAFKREEVSEALILYGMIKEASQDKDRELVYNLITCPVDTRTTELVYYWRDCVRAIFKNRHVPEPHFDLNTLIGCELEYKAYDIRHQLLRRIGQEDSTEEMREFICQRIKELMAQDKSAYIRKCTLCGKELPIGYSFNICEKCYNETIFH